MLAIIIPYYKLTFFEATLQSLANQTDKRFKVYIGDDASPENPSILLEKYNGKFDFVYHRFETNLGGISLAQQWERCMDLSGNEEWLMILGDDDVLGENVVEEFCKNLPEIEKEEISVIRYATCKINEVGDIISDVYKHHILETGEDFLIRKYKFHIRSSLSEYIFRSNIIKSKKIKNFPLAWYSDICSVLECSCFKFIYTINNSIVYVRYSSSNISSFNDIDSLSKKNISQRLFCNFLLDNFSKMNDKKGILKIVMNYYKNDSKNFLLFFRIMKIHIQNLYFISFFCFLLVLFRKLKNIK